MKRIAFIIPSLHGAGFEKLFSLIAPYLLQYFKIDLILFEKIIDYPIPKEINIHSLDLSNDPNISLVKKIVRFQKRILRLAHTIKHNNYNLIVSSLETTNIATFLAYKFFKIKKPLIFMERTINYNFFKYNSYAKKNKKVLIYLLGYVYNSSIYKYILSPSIDVKYFLINELNVKPSKIKIIPNAVDPVKLKIKLSNKIDKVFLNTRIRIINVGRFDNNNKNQELALRIFKYIKNRFPEAKLFFFGKGKDEDFIRNLALIYGLKNEVVFMGWKENIEDYLKLATVLLHTTKYESFGNVILEALAVGTPVLTTSYGLVLCDFKNYLEYCKFLQTCDLDDINCFVDKLTNILKKPPSQKERIEVSNIFLKTFSKEKIAQIYIDLFKQCAE